MLKLNVRDLVETEEKSLELLSLLGELLGEPSKVYNSKHQITYDCPTCSAMKGVDYDGKGNLEINYDLGVYNCWACAETHDTKGKLYKLFKDSGNNELLRRFILGRFKFSSEYYSDDSQKNIDVDKLQLPDYHVLLSNSSKDDFKSTYNYLYSRGVTDEIIKKYHIGFCYDGKYKNRVVIPSYDINGDLDYFITRSISKYSKKYKYLNPNVDKTKVIFNECLINWDKPVFLVEGVFDHIVTPNSIPLLGKKLYDLLFYKLYFNAKNYVIIALDPDAYQDAVNIFNKLNSGKLRKKVLINLLPEKYDISSFNETFGPAELTKWLKKNNYKLND